MAALATILPSSAQADKGGNGGGWGGGNGGGKGHCFLRGTHILTPQGEVRIEDLRIGDLVEVVRGEAMPIKWIGRNTFKKSGSSWPESIVPIRVSRNAIEAQTPHTDLYLSPGHALFIDGLLMPVKDLVNETSIATALPPGVEVIEYFHIVLDTHEVVLAEGVPAETLLMTSGKEYETFTNFVEYERLYPNEPGFVMSSFAPRYNGWAHVMALLRLGVSNVVDVRDPFQRAYDRIAARAEALVV